MGQAEIDKRRIDAQLERMQASTVFQNAGRMYPLLEYLVAAELNGRGERVSQHAIAVDVLGRDVSFDPQSDSIARVEAGRLRAKLHEYYATEGANDDVQFELPKGQYRPLIRISESASFEPLPHQEIGYCKTPDGVMLAYAQMGNGPPIVKTSTWLTHLEVEYENGVWHHYLRELSRGRQLIRYDSRNMGLSDRNVDRFDLDALVTDLETIADHFGLERFPIFGTSAGVPVAVAYAARHPDRVSHLILLGGMLRGPRRTDNPHAKDFADAVEASMRYGWQQPASDFRRVICRALIPDGSKDQYEALDDLQIASCNVDAVLRYTDLVHHIEVSEEAKLVRAPTLVCHAKHELIPFAEARYIAAHIQKTRIVALDTRNHLLQPHEPAWPQFVGELNRFLESE